MPDPMSQPGRILIIDDNERIHTDFRLALGVDARAGDLDALESELFGAEPATTAQAGYRIDSALQGEPAMEMVRDAAADDPYMMAFVDMRMPPGWDGLKTIEACWSVDPRMQVVICTAFSDYSWDEIRARLGRTDRLLILRKPFDRVEVCQLAAALCEKWRLGRRAENREAELEAKVGERTGQLEQALRKDRLRLDLLESVIDERTRELRHAAMHDKLTGLPNRSMLSDELSHAIAHRHADPSSAFGVMFLDLDDFKLVNDTLGHDAGDELLRQLTARIGNTLDIARQVPDCNRLLAGRLGGDEFVILYEGANVTAATTDLALKLLTAVVLPFDIKGQSARCGASIGIAAGTADYNAVEDILRDADIAMYQAKAGKNRFVIFKPEMHDAVVARVSLTDQIRQGIEAGQFVLHYQPIVSLVDGSLGGFEALVRWNHPDGQLLPPGRFIALAEATGLIRPLGLWILECAIQQLAAWSKAFPNRNVPVAVNLAPAQLGDSRLVPTLLMLIARHGIDPSRLVIEVTEGAISDSDGEGEKILSAIRCTGVRIYIDDFGTGYSSLGRLPRLPVDGIKIDRSFISESGEQRKYAAIINAVINLAGHVGADVVAEGVEQIGQVAMLQALGCERAQGFYFSPALPVDQATACFTQSWCVGAQKRAA